MQERAIADQLGAGPPGERALEAPEVGADIRRLGRLRRPHLEPVQHAPHDGGEVLALPGEHHAHGEPLSDLGARVELVQERMPVVGRTLGQRGLDRRQHRVGHAREAR